MDDINIEFVEETINIEFEEDIINISFTDVGPQGVGVPEGGDEGQVLAKASDDDYDTEWVDPSGGGAVS